MSFFVLNNQAKGQRTPSSNQSVLQWQLDATINGVAFYHTVTDCNGKKTVLLKLHNTNKYHVDASWQSSFDNTPRPDANPLSVAKKITLKPGEMLANSCGNTSYEDLLVDPVKANPTHAVDARSFAFRQISVNRSSLN